MTFTLGEANEMKCVCTGQGFACAVLKKGGNWTGPSELTQSQTVRGLNLLVLNSAQRVCSLRCSSFPLSPKSNLCLYVIRIDLVWLEVSRMSRALELGLIILNLKWLSFSDVTELICSFGVHCEKSVKSENLHAPSYNPDNRSCTFQAISLLFSCVSTDEAHIRLCPCRDYQSGQVAICQNCD